ncbi:MAG: IS256 family transposase [Alphaproteobacteria bacterium]|nr:IS256 family transposase [Alphaproteobacteria bacterium]
MTKDTTKAAAVVAENLLFDDWVDAIEVGVRGRVRGFIETMLEEELDAALSRPRYGRRKPSDAAGEPAVVGCRHGHRQRTLTGTFGKTRILVPRARLVCAGEEGKTREWKSGSLRAYQRRTKAADALIASAYLSGTNTRRVRRALQSVFAGAVGKDVVSRTWRKVKGDWDLWNARTLGDEPIVRLILDGTVVRVRLDKKATSISLLVALGVRADGQKVLLAVKNMGGESEAAWRALLDDLVKRGLPTPELVIVDGAPGLEKALAALWSNVPVQRCTVHKHRNLLAHAPERLHEEISNDYKDMIYAKSKQEIEAKRKAFIRKWRLKHRPVADSLEEAGDKLFTFTRFPPSQWRSIRTSNAIERLHEEFKRRIKTQTVLPGAETAAMLFWALLASGQITMRKVDGWESLAEKPSDQLIDLAA